MFFISTSEYFLMFDRWHCESLLISDRYTSLMPPWWQYISTFQLNKHVTSDRAIAAMPPSPVCVCVAQLVKHMFLPSLIKSCGFDSQWICLILCSRLPPGSQKRRQRSPTPSLGSARFRCWQHFRLSFSTKWRIIFWNTVCFIWHVRYTVSLIEIIQYTISRFPMKKKFRK